MKIKRFVAPSMRHAMQQVRDSQGPDAVILSTRRTAEGVEIVAAIDYDEALMRQAAGSALAAAAAPPASPERVDADAAEKAASGTATEPTAELQESCAPADALPAGIERRSVPQVSLSPLIQDMQQQLGSLREMLETQLASLAWNDLNRRHPIRAGVLRLLTRMDISADVAQAVAETLPESAGADKARYLPLGILTQRLTADTCEPADLTGVVMFAGGTGVGKTTTIAKLAAHAIMRHGAAQVALVSTDHYRVGSSARLAHYARLLGLAIHEAREPAELTALLARLQDRRLVLVDTAGASPRDPHLARQLALLRTAQPPARTLLVLAANTHAEAMERGVQAFGALRVDGAVLTKLDEAPRLGAALSVLIRHRLPLAFTTNGQRVPEDITPADVRRLVCRAALIDPSDQADNDAAMAARFGQRAGVPA